MKLVAGTTALVAGLVAVVLLWLDGPAEFTGYQVLLLVLAAVAIRRLRPLEFFDKDDTPLRQRIRSPGRPRRSVPPQLERIQRLVSFGKTTAFDAEWRLLPFLRSIAAEQLEVRHGVDPTQNPEVARRLLGEAGWDLLRPDRELPVDRMAPGLKMDTLEEVLTAVEQL